MSKPEMSRLDTIDTGRGDLELGITDVLQKHFSRKPVQRRTITQRQLDFERSRPRWLREMFAEATGVFFYGPPSYSSKVSRASHS